MSGPPSLGGFVRVWDEPTRYISLRPSFNPVPARLPGLCLCTIISGWLTHSSGPAGFYILTVDGVIAQPLTGPALSPVAARLCLQSREESSADGPPPRTRLR